MIVLLIVVGVQQICQCRKHQNTSNHPWKDGYEHIAPRHPYPEDDQHRAQEQAYWVWYIKAQKHTTRVNVAVALFAFLAMIGGFLTFSEARQQATEAHNQVTASQTANQMNAESGRAWIAPGKLEITQQLTLENGIKGRLYYTNPGREPATQVQTIGAFGVIKFPDGKSYSDLIFPEFDENSCGGASKKQATVAFPTSPPNGFAFDIIGDPQHLGYFLPVNFIGKKLSFEQRAIQDVFEKRGALIALGCFTYITTQKERVTLVCYVLEPNDHPLSSWEWHFCPTGQKAT